MSKPAKQLKPNPYPGGPDKTRDALLPKLVPKPWIRAPPKGMVLADVYIVDPGASKLYSTKVFGSVEFATTAALCVLGGKVHSILPQTAVGDAQTFKVDGEELPVFHMGRLYVCPGLIDCHVHVNAVPGFKAIGELFDTSEELVSLRSTYVLKEMLSRGFTTVRDTGGASKGLAAAIDEGLIEGPRLFQCGKAISQTGGHGDFARNIRASGGCCGGEVKSLARVVDGVDAVLRATREEIKGGADFIKIMAGGGVASATDAIETVQFLSEEVQAITRTCNQMGNIHTTAHAYTVESINHAIDNGVRGIEHGNLIDEATAKKMAEKGVFLTPTLSCYGIMVRPPFEDFLPEQSKRKNEEVMQNGLRALEIAEKAGVCVCFGTDLLISMHALQTEEFRVRSAVLPSPAVLKHATTNAAKLLRREGQIGVVAAGAFADLIILDKNPLEDITVLDRPEDHLKAVIKEGRVVRSSLEKLPIGASE
ncbi:hypothetical protein AURDEDRAFT_115887 [Auricularia subglabra TFB-10046 SS5]|nr:hypothetical protein AURDEDRAFT_115887 [Auricularia subglabra TFB-10046 SS5]